MNEMSLAELKKTFAELDKQVKETKKYSESKEIQAPINSKSVVCLSITKQGGRMQPALLSTKKQ